MKSTPSIFLLAHSVKPPTDKLIRFLADLNLPTQVVKTSEGEPLPDLTNVRGLIIMGAPFAIYDAPKLPWLQKEMAFVQAALAQNIPMFGICFGCQMLAKLVGGTVFQGEQGREFGFTEVRHVSMGSLLTDLHKLEVFQDHGDTYSIKNTGAVTLLDGEKYTQQGAQFNGNVFGVQFHPEITPDIVQRWHSNWLNVNAPHIKNITLTPPEHAKVATDKFAKSDVWFKGFLAELFT